MMDLCLKSSGPLKYTCLRGYGRLLLYVLYLLLSLLVVIYSAFSLSLESHEKRLPGHNSMIRFEPENLVGVEFSRATGTIQYS